MLFRSSEKDGTGEDSIKAPDDHWVLEILALFFSLCIELRIASAFMACRPEQQKICRSLQEASVIITIESTLHVDPKASINIIFCGTSFPALASEGSSSISETHLRLRISYGMTPI